MSKIVTAINVMVSNPKLITNVLQGENQSEIFFIYDGKHPWSIMKRTEGDYYMAYYPGRPEIAQLASIPDEYWGEANIRYVAYFSKDLGTKEAKESMAELYAIVNEKVSGMDEVLDDIIKSDPPF